MNSQLMSEFYLVNFKNATFKLKELPPGSASDICIQFGASIGCLHRLHLFKLRHTVVEATSRQTRRKWSPMSSTKSVLFFRNLKLKVASFYEPVCQRDCKVCSTCAGNFIHELISSCIYTQRKDVLPRSLIWSQRDSLEIIFMRVFEIDSNWLRDVWRVFEVFELFKAEKIRKWPPHRWRLNVVGHKESKFKSRSIVKEPVLQSATH